jgi:hypothetical protein
MQTSLGMKASEPGLESLGLPLSLRWGDLASIVGSFPALSIGLDPTAAEIAGSGFIGIFRREIIKFMTLPNLNVVSSEFR